MTPNERFLTYEQVAELFCYVPETGRLYWKERRASFFSRERIAKTWNSRYAGKEAFTAFSNGYLHGAIFDTRYLAHRVAWILSTGSWPINYIDHINGNRSDNRLCNLREATVAENRRNASMQSNCTSGVNGVHWHRLSGKWQAHIKVNRKRKHLGLFDTIEDATAARKAADAFYGFTPRHGEAI